MPPRILPKLLAWWKKPVDEKVVTVVFRYYALQNWLFVKRHSLDFDGNVPRAELVAESTHSLSNANAYQPYNNYNFKQLIHHAISIEPRPRTFVDVGCGKGKQCIYARKYFDFDAIIGIDFSRPLIDAAKANLARTGYNDIQLIVADAVEWKLPDTDCLVFLYNPFNAVILDAFLRNNLDHFRTHDSFVVYANDHRRKVLKTLGFDTVYRDDHMDASVYRFEVR